MPPHPFSQHPSTGALAFDPPMGVVATRLFCLNEERTLPVLEKQTNMMMSCKLGGSTAKEAWR